MATLHLAYKWKSEHVCDDSKRLPAPLSQPEWKTSATVRGQKMDAPIASQ